MKCTCVRSQLSLAFGKLGLSVGTHPLLYFVVPLAITALLSLGFFWIHEQNDVEYQFFPINGRAHKEREAVESIFPPTLYSSDAYSTTRTRELAIILLEPKDRGSVLREFLLEESLRIEHAIQSISITWKNESFSLADLCKKSPSGNCHSNDVLLLRGKIQNIRRKKLFIKYPLEMNGISQQVTIYAIGLGGVTTDESNNILDAKALRLVYFLDYLSSAEISTKWIRAFLDKVSKLHSAHFNIIRFTEHSLNEETSRILETVWPILLVGVPVMIIFAIVTCMTTDCVTSKPWVAVAGSITPALGFISAFGLLFILGFEVIQINIAIAFIMLGIGLDDAFIMLAAWRKADEKESIEQRLSETYAKSAISITVTSVTNIVSLCVGFGSDFRMVRIYCTYATVSFLFAYIYQITFFGGALALSGIREQKGLHAFFCKPVEVEPTQGGCLAKQFYTGCKRVTVKDERTSLSSYTQLLVNKMLTKCGKIVVIISFLLYLLSSSYCLTMVKDEFDYLNIVPYKSYARDYLTLNLKYFSRYSNIVHLVVNETMDYSNPSVQRNIEDLIKEFSNSDNMAKEEFSYSWLNYYLQSTKDERLWLSYYGYNFSDPNDFVEGLREVFLKFPSAKIFRQHIKFDKNQTKITASRFSLLSDDISSSDQGKQLASSLWKKADSCQYSVYIHSIYFPFYEAFIMISTRFATPLLIASGMVTAVFFIVIPDIFTTVTIFLTIVSIEIGVVGFMSLWDVPIDPISMLSLMMSIGLSIDYAAHISYGYLSSAEDNPDEKSRYALQKAGYPIIQGCVTTLLGVSFIPLAPIPGFLTFTKIVTLVMIISLFHGLLVIPVALNLLETLWSVVFYQSKKCVVGYC